MVPNSVIHAETSKKEDTWYETLTHCDAACYTVFENTLRRWSGGHLVRFATFNRWNGKRNVNEFDQFVKHELKAKHYIRYADDFIVMAIYRYELEEILSKIKEFLKTELQLELHPNKVSIRTLGSGVDFLGWVHFSKHRVLRTVTKRRMLKSMKNASLETRASYLGLLSHGNTYKLRQQLG